ncbi:MAG: hypothetical protein ACK542_00565 [Burkholderiales bacterium]
MKRVLEAVFPFRVAEDVVLMREVKEPVIVLQRIPAVDGAASPRLGEVKGKSFFSAVPIEGI